jgi:NADH-quinone oxidoreductase subunit A
VALAYNKGLVIRDFVEIVIFIGILSLAIVYAWRKGVFNWQRRR